MAIQIEVCVILALVNLVNVVGLKFLNYSSTNASRYPQLYSLMYVRSAYTMPALCSGG